MRSLNRTSNFLIAWAGQEIKTQLPRWENKNATRDLAIGQSDSDWIERLPLRA